MNLREHPAEETKVGRKRSVINSNVRVFDQGTPKLVAWRKYRKYNDERGRKEEMKVIVSWRRKRGN
jgi:hypothetical protein